MHHPPLLTYRITQVFELRISSPTEVSVLTRGEEYRGLKAANATFLGGSHAGGGREVEPEMMGGDRLYMRVRWVCVCDVCVCDLSLY